MAERGQKLVDHASRGVADAEDERLPRGRLRWALAGYAMWCVGRMPLRMRLALLAREADPMLRPHSPAMPDMVRMLEAGGMPPLMTPDVDTASLVRRFPELGAVAMHDLRIAGPHGSVPARLYRAAESKVSPTGVAFVWVHGGAFVSGTLDETEAHWTSLALAARGIPVLSLDYHKALNGVHYPIPSDDVLAGWQWAATYAEDAFGVPIERVHFGGASAGGDLAGGVTKRLRDGAGGPLPASVALIYPVAHGDLPEMDAAELQKIEQIVHPSLFYSPQETHDMGLNYAGSRAVMSDPYAFPANGDVSGQPPVYIQDCEYDALKVSGLAYAERLAAAGVTVREEVFPGALHGYFSMPYSHTAWRALDRLARWLTGGAEALDAQPL